VCGRVPQVIHGPLVQVLVERGLRVVAQQIGALLDLAQRLDAVLADFDGHQRAVEHLPFADEIRGPSKDLDAARPAQRAPGGLGCASGRDGVTDVPACAPGETPHDDVLVDGTTQLDLAVTGAFGPADDVGV
jgi:hypothetical protein